MKTYEKLKQSDLSQNCRTLRLATRFLQLSFKQMCFWTFQRCRRVDGLCRCHFSMNKWLLLLLGCLCLPSAMVNGSKTTLRYLQKRYTHVRRLNFGPKSGPSADISKFVKLGTWRYSLYCQSCFSRPSASLKLSTPRLEASPRSKSSTAPVLLNLTLFLLTDRSQNQHQNESNK
jgi:hypothetical protein